MLKISCTTNVVEALQALPLLVDLTALYPDFTHWYVNKALPGIVLGHGTLLLAKDGQTLVGAALGKRSKKETKLRCVRVLPAYQHTGVGVRLIDQALDALECDKPHCTVAEEMLHLYSRLFVTRYGFKLDAVDKGVYRPRKLEYIFNAI